MLHILVADDDPLLTEIVRFRLEAAGYRLTSADNGEKALSAIQADRPDLVVLDAMMPIMAGQQVLERLKAEPDTAAIPVIMLTARKGQNDIVSALQAGAEDYLTKPFIPDELVLRVNTVLARSGARHASH